MAEYVPFDHNIHGHLFQAQVWRQYAMAWDGRPTPDGATRSWVEKILRIPRAECLRRARMHAEAARRINREPSE